MYKRQALDLSTKPSVVLFIGVNGVGKTTTIGKIGAQLKKERKKVLLCAADTFRAAAAEQLTICCLLYTSKSPELESSTPFLNRDALSSILKRDRWCDTIKNYH